MHNTYGYTWLAKEINKDEKSIYNIAITLIDKYMRDLTPTS